MSEIRAVAVFGSSATRPGTPEWEDAERAGARLARAGLTVVTGGYGGTMEAASRGASISGGRVIGVTAPSLFPGRTGANRYVNEEMATESLVDRLRLLTDLVHGALVLPGSIGTAAELVLAWNLNHIARIGGGRRIPTVAVGTEWMTVWTMFTDLLGAHGEDVHTVEDVGVALDWLLAQPEID